MAEKNVRIRLFKDNSRYKGDLFVSVNGVNYKIRRGVEVEVPPAVAEVLEHSIKQDAEGFYIPDYDYCKACGICINECPKKTISMQPEEK